MSKRTHSRTIPMVLLDAHLTPLEIDMKILTLFLALSFALPTFAGVSAQQSLEKSLDEYQYSLAVEWNQKDTTFQEQVNQKFINTVKDLITNHNLTAKDVEALVVSRSLDKKQIEALKLKLSLAGASSEELSKVIINHSKELYTKGASWNGNIFFHPLSLLAVSVAFMLIANAIMEADEKVCVEYGEVYMCWSNAYDESECGYRETCLRHEKKNK